MDYDNIDVDKIVEEVHKAEDEGRLLPTSKQKSMLARLAALSAIVRNMQEIVEKDYNLSCSSKSA
ncbi:hypothetical protein R84B8_03000 [Treponema sp. R8-4-B8]